MIRVVLAVVLAAALLGLSLPAVQSAAEAGAENAVVRSADELTDAARAFRANSDPSAPGTPGARTTVRIEFPERSLSNAGFDYLAVGGHPNRSLERDTATSDVLVYRLPGRAPRTRSLPFDVRAGSGGDDDPLVLRGDAALHLEYLATRNGTVVAVSRAR